MEELEKAHLDYEKRKIKIITNLSTLINVEALFSHERKWIEEAIEFIKEKEI